MTPILQVTDFRLARADGWSVALPSLQLRGGDVAALYGPSGCGKTSALLGLFGLQAAAFRRHGRVELLGEKWHELAASSRRQHLRHTAAYVLQDGHSLLDPLQPVGQQIIDATAAAPASVRGALKAMGIAHAGEVVQRLPHQISGGQAQRVLLAIAWLREPQLLLADEPTASLDGDNFADVVARLQRLCRTGRTAVLLATHDDRLLRALDARVLECRDRAFVPGRMSPADWPQRERRPVDTLPLLSARGVSVAFGEHQVLDGVDLELRRGEVVALVGESGAGKTTLARVLAGHRPPDQGSIVGPRRREAVQLLFQEPLASLTPGRTITSLLDETQAPYLDLPALAHDIGLAPERLSRTAAELSGGERRRAALLRALSVNPDVLVLDEPTASLDRRAAIAVIKMLLTVQRQRDVGMLLITHDLSL
ncbi:MAG TPA: ATP-binding cassette domain-containing protein, partial [Planctomycetota bacterium]|nr:ATP-binding cassette domain-containing protein [Planctomycetota bacterium]